ncbi:MAG: LamB/YcsF family protein, partial [Euryarchaeota archaeon]|nr:LamB/YcsF family protein [Euryarchaeota archaeon]
IDGEWIEIHADTICVHGDNPEAVELVKYIRRRLEEEGIEVLPMGNFL